ncbi:MAG: cytochrome c biogenesis protein CcsA, partial [Muribaculaceae bacterium]|nr:cytochrome c biogenesis protein CcsA [Muribaculaceae bacterium]
GEAFRIFPYRTAGGEMEWLSLTGRRPSQMGFEQWEFMVGSMPHIKTELLQGHNIKANELIQSLREGQLRYAGIDNLPADSQFRVEIFYNRYVRLWVIGLFILSFSLLLLLMTIRGAASTKVKGVSALFSILVATVILSVLIARGYISGHLPLVNGCETMLFMAFAASVISIFYTNGLLRSSLLLVTAIALFVASMSGKTPQIGSLMPVLDSPLLSIHVILVMCSYVIFLLMAILAVIGLTSERKMMDKTATLNRTLLTPAVFLITAGIFIGAVWANQSWGRYWGWDPKETCALVTMLIYAVPIHTRSLRVFRRNRVVNIYLLCAILSVAFTYFGANYLLPGLHSYA